ncbi:hypothetical protein BLA6860_01956 [Burkholderia lata]|nr:hypothetical protein BLA6860_01956 [Burkholderia lata]
MLRDECDSVGRLPGLSLDEFVNALMRGVGSVRRIPRPQQQTPLVGIEQIDLADRLLRVGERCLDEVKQPLPMRLHACSIVKLGIPVHVQRTPGIARIAGHGHGEIVDEAIGERMQGRTTVAEFPPVVERNDIDAWTENRCGDRTAQLLDLLHAELLVLHVREHFGAHVPCQFHERHLRRNGQPHRQDVGEHPGQRARLLRAGRYREIEHGYPAVARSVKVGRHDGRENERPLRDLRLDPVELSGERKRKRRGFPPEKAARVRRLADQGFRSRQGVDVVLPVPAVVRVARRRPVGTVTVRHQVDRSEVCVGSWLVPRKCRIDLGNPACHERDARTIHHDVVIPLVPDMALVAELEQHLAEQLAGEQVVGRVRLDLHDIPASGKRVGFIRHVDKIQPE